MNRAQRRAAKKRKPTASAESRRALRYADQLFVFRYCENDWWRISTGYGFRGIVPPKQQPEAHNLALAIPLHWHAISITYMQDQWGKKYRMFGFARTGQKFVGMDDSICPLLQSALDEAEEGVNDRHIYARGMVFAPWSKAYDTLAPILKLKQKQLRLTDHDIEEVARAEKGLTQSDTRFFILEDDVESEIAALLQAAS